MKNLSDYVYISQMDSDITDLTDKIFEENIEWQKHKWADTQGEVVNSDDIDVVYHDGKDEKDEKLYQEIFKHITQYGNTDYGKWARQTGLEHLSDFRFNRYEANTFMAEHVDHIRSLFDGEQKGIPVLSIIGLLNDDFTGGEFVLCDEVIPLKKNSLMIWPSVFLYPHKVMQIKSGTRYTFVGWAW
jgi:predicted 2-oxoglutarate/Fe(II)-dependent dioxygenase YbiX